MTQTLPIHTIRRNGGTQVRAQTDWLIVDDYVHAMRDGAIFPPIVVYFDGSDYWLSDGFHRAEAAERAGLTELPADVRRGTQRDAILHACSANASHGLRRTNADKRRAVETLLGDAEWVKWNDSEIARRCAVGHAFVSQMRNSIFPQKKDTPRTVTRNGTTYTQNTANIGKPVAPAPEPEPLPAWVGAEPKPYINGNIPPTEPIFSALFDRAQDDELDEEVDVPYRFDSGDSAYCKYCYQTHDKWEIVDDRVWMCELCEHATHDDYMQIVESPEPEPEPEPMPAPVTQVTIINADAQQVGELVTEPVHLVVTSPPYNVDIEYDQHNDNLTTYIPMLMNVWRGCYRVMADGARIAVVVPFGVGRNPYIPFDCQIMQTLIDVGFTLRGRIVWDKNTTGNRTSWGSYRLPSSPSLRDTTECIIVAHKGSDSLEIPADLKRRDEKGTHTEWLADGDYFMGLAQDHWVIAPESAQRVKHPAPFPAELVTRLIHFYAFPGAHILDPFGGSGTTALAAKRLGCDATIIELSENYCQLAKGRIANE